MLKIENLTKEYKNRNEKKTALDHVSMELGDGIHALLGPNGAGKSTLMKLITCNIEADDGIVSWIDEWEEKENNISEIRKMGARYRAMLGYAPQQQGLYEAFSGYRFLQYMSVLKAIPKKEIDSEIQRVAKCVNLQNVLRNKISSYSGGMKQRLLIAQALLGNPKILIFDEPTVGLDPNERVRIREYIKCISAGKIIIIATHIVSDVESIADEVLIMKQGRIAEQDSVEQLCEKYNTDSLENVYVNIFQDLNVQEAEEEQS